MNKGIATIAVIIILVVAIAAGILIGTATKKAPVQEKLLFVAEEGILDERPVEEPIEELAEEPEAAPQEFFVNQPGEVKLITSIGVNQWVLAVDLLTHNPNFIPGVSGFFINQNPKIRNLNVTNTTNTYLCGAGPDGNETTADVPQNTSSFMQGVQSRINEFNQLNIQQQLATYVAYYFDIERTDITAIYQQCLP